MFKKLTGSLTALLLLVFAHNVSAQSLNKESIVNGLVDEKPMLTRSLVKQTSVNTSFSADELNRLKVGQTRGLVIEKVSQIDEMIESKGLPSLDIYLSFEINSDQIAEKSEADLAILGQALKDERLTQSRFLINGHTDSLGDNKYNLKLSQRRAETVKTRLISDFQIAEDRLIALGFGEERLKNRDMPESEDNRRVEIMNIGGN